MLRLEGVRYPPRISGHDETLFNQACNQPNVQVKCKERTFGKAMHANIMFLL